jgi:hypothetical protein
MSGEHRWQGYRHAELYERIHTGPGPDASTSASIRCNDMIGALGEIDADPRKAVAGSGATGEGAAAEGAGGGLNPLGRWADDARTAALVMKESTEAQAEHIGRARAEMPAPVTVTAEQPSSLVSGLVHLFGGQTDYERQEAAADNAEQRAFEVMRTYEAGTTHTTSILGRFTPPPRVVVRSGAESPRGEAPARASGPTIGVALPRTVAAPADRGTREVPSEPAPGRGVSRTDGDDQGFQATDYLIAADDVYGTGERVAPAVFGEVDR